MCVLFQENFRPGISFADGSILCTALGGDHNKDLSPALCRLWSKFSAEKNITDFASLISCVSLIISGCPPISCPSVNLDGETVRYLSVEEETSCLDSQPSGYRDGCRLINKIGQGYISS